MTCAANPSEDSLFTAVSEAFVQAVREGKARSIEDYAAQYPGLADRIAEEFPLIELAEQLNRRTKQAVQSNPLPEMIGKYRIKSEIGRGGMGRVYAAYLPRISREYAIKVISVQNGDSRDSLIRFQREAKSVGKLTHPNIIPVCDYGVHEGLLYFVMPRIKGLDLSKVIDGLALQRSRSDGNTMVMDWQMVARVGAQAASALEYAHKKGLVHRDIKPANLIMESNGHTWVSDFGLVKNLLSDQSLSNTGDLIGTPRYMAPEQLRGVCDERSDIYGLGLTLFELASGCRAWENMSGFEIVAKRSSLELPSIRSANPAIPETLCDIIMKCCAFKPDDRYQTAKEVHYVLDRYLSGHRVGDRRRMRNAERTILNRRPIRLARTAATLVGIGIFSGYLYAITNRPPQPTVVWANLAGMNAPALPDGMGYVVPPATLPDYADPTLKSDASAGVVEPKKEPASPPSAHEETPAESTSVVGNASEVERAATTQVAPIQAAPIQAVPAETVPAQAAPPQTAPTPSAVASGPSNRILPTIGREQVAMILHEFNQPQIMYRMLPSGMKAEDPLYLAASEFDWVYLTVVRSNWQAKEKAAGQRILENFKRAVLFQKLSPMSVGVLNNRLIDLVTLVPESSEVPEDQQKFLPAISDNNLRRFLGFVEIELTRASAITRPSEQVNVPQQNPNSQDNFLNSLDALIKDPGVRHFLNSYK